MTRERTIEEVIREFRSKRLRLTPSRQAILQALLKEHGPFTAEEIHKLVTKRVCDLATVYRSVANLADAGILRRCEFGDGSARYELAEPGDTHHHHLICVECKRVEIVDDAELEEIDRFARKRGYSQISHTLEFFGRCPQCA